MKAQLSKINSRNISIIWDFDKTLTPMDSTTELIKIFTSDIDVFWKQVKNISGVDAPEPMNSISTSEAPVWMYRLSEMAKLETRNKGILLDHNTLKTLIAHKIELYPKVLSFLQKIKNLATMEPYKSNNVKIHHFIITAGLKDLVTAVFEYHNAEELITETFGCKYRVIQSNTGAIKNIPIYCMDKTTKTRALFEISKGCFLPSAQYKVDDLVPKEEEWCPFENMIYIGDGDTDIPAFSLIKSRTGLPIGVFEPNQSSKKTQNIRKGRRIDLFTEADFAVNKELYKFIDIRCQQIVHRYKAQI